MNKLYAILMAGASATGDYAWYAKHHDDYILTERMQQIRDLIVQGADEKLPLLVSQICAMILYTQFGQRIKELDSNNTYVDVTRPATADNNDSKYCLYDVIKPVNAYQKIRLYLNDDIASVVDNESWLDLIAAGCLQLLREVVV
jgi:hypothetical protein